MVVMVVWLEVMVVIVVGLQTVVAVGWVVVIVSSVVGQAVIDWLLTNVLNHLVAYVLWVDSAGRASNIPTLNMIVEGWVAEGGGFYSSSQENGLEEGSHSLIW